MINGSMRVWVCQVCSKDVWNEGKRCVWEYEELEKRWWIGEMQMWKGYVKQNEMLQYFQ